MYNSIWTREKHIEYRKLKKEGWSTEMLLEHFGNDIYHSGMYNRKSTIIPWLNFITEIKITPELTNYEFIKVPSDIYQNKQDYIIKFSDNNIDYVIAMFYYIISNNITYNILLTTEKQLVDYKNQIKNLGHMGYITDQEREDLIDIVEKETGYNQIYSILKKVSYILFDFINKEMNSSIIISIGETRKIVKINLYRNIIKNSFPNVIDKGSLYDNDGNKYFIYKI